MRFEELKVYQKSMGMVEDRAKFIVIIWINSK